MSTRPIGFIGRSIETSDVHEKVNSMPYWQLFYHIVWSTKDRLPLLTPEIELVIYGFLRSKAIGLGATLFALNGVADHVHMVAAVPPKIAVAKFIGQVNAVASTKFKSPGKALHLSFGKKSTASFLSTASDCRITSPMSSAKKNITRRARLFQS